MPDSEFESIDPLSLADVTIEDSFWRPRLETLQDVTMEVVYDRLEETGRIDNFRIAAGRIEGEFSGRYYNDSDVYKWLEGACYQLILTESPALRDRVEGVIDLIEAAQEPDGYLNTYFTLVEPDAKWTNLHAMHELFCAGHLFEAAVAHHRATGEERLLDVARRLANHIDDTFGTNGERGYPGHEEIELALVKLYRETEEKRYLNLARYFIEERGRTPSRFERELDNGEEIGGHTYDHVVKDGEYDGTYFQDHASVWEQDTVEGHAVRATYLYCGMADIAMETDDRGLYNVLENLWENMTERRMYVTGGIGSTHDGERFTTDYDLPNETSYAETCAALGNVLWNHRMLQLTGDSRFGDLMERILYNGLLAGISLSGDRFFYANPLEINGDEHVLRDIDANRFNNQRQPWFETACCPTNIPRLLFTLGQKTYLRNTDTDELYVNLYLASSAETTLAGTDFTITQRTEYPWDDTVEIEVEPEEPVAFALKLRVPDYCDDFNVRIGGKSFDPEIEDGFLILDREWTGDRKIELSLEYDIDRLVAHPSVRENTDRAAIRWGPLLYCLEGTDHEQPLADYVLPEELEGERSFRTSLLDGVVTLTVDALVADRERWKGELYRSSADIDPENTRITLVPYYGWGHRAPGEMRIWIRSQHLSASERST